MTTFAHYSATQIAALSLNEVAAMTAEQWATVTPVAFAGVTAAQLARFSTAQIQILSLKQIGAITAAAMAGLSAAQVAVLPVVAVAAFSAAQLAAMLSTTIAALTAAQLANVSVVNLSGLSAQQVAAISTAARSGLSDQQKNALLTVTVRQEAKRMFANDAARRRGDDDSMLIATIQLKQGTVELDRAVKEASGVAIVGNSSAKMTISGTIAQINAAVNGLIFVVPANFSGTTGLDVAVKYKDLDVTLPKAQNTNGDTTLVFNKVNGNAITVADVDATYLTAIYTFYIKVQGGTLALSRTATGMGVDLIAGNSGLLARGTVAEINNALDGLIFTPLKDYNGISDLQIVDSRGEFRSITVNVVAVDVVAVIGGTSTATLTESNAVLTAKGRLTLTDVDSEVSANPFKAQSDIIGKGKYGEFNLAKDGSWTYETTSAHNNFVAGQTYIDSLDVVANDGTKGTITVSIVGTNDAPVITARSRQSLDKNNSFVFSSSNGGAGAITVGDVDSDRMDINVDVANGALTFANRESGAKITSSNQNKSVRLQGTRDQVNKALNGLSYNSKTGLEDIVTVLVFDDKKAIVEKRITLQAYVNAAPVVTTPVTETFNENADRVFNSENGNAITVGDVDSTELTTTVTASEGTLTLGSLVSGANITAGTNKSARVRLSGTAVQINTALSGLTYTPVLNSNGDKKLTVTTSDGNLESVQTIALKVIPVNSAPTITLRSSIETFDEDTSRVFSSLNKNAITVADVDSTALTTTLTASEGTLALGSVASGAAITAGANNSATVTLSGTAAQINSTLDGLIYTPLLNANGAKTLTVSTNDGAKALSFSGTIFDHTSPYVQLTNPVISGDVTLEAWVYYTAGGQPYATFLELAAFKKGDRTSVLGLGVSKGHVYFETDGRFTRQTSMLNSGWNHIAATLSTGDISKIYINGNVAGKDSFNAKINIGTVFDRSYLGFSGSRGHGFTGKLRDIRIWDVERSQAQIRANMGTWNASAPESASAVGLKTWIPVTDADPVTNKAHGAAPTITQPKQPALAVVDSVVKTIALNVTPVNDTPVFKLAGAQVFDHTVETTLPLTPSGTTLDNTFSVELTVAPGREIIWPENLEKSIVRLNDYLLYPEHGGDNAGFGMTVGTNGVVVSEHGANQLALLLVWKGNVNAGTKLAVVVTNKKPQLYVNGTLAETGRQSSRSTLFVRPGSGVGGGGYGYYSGAASDLRYWDKALSATEVATNYQKQPSPYAANLNAVYLSSTGNKNTITENLANGTVVGQAFATDIDSPTLTYSLNGAGSDAFAIDASSGEITVRDATKLGIKKSNVDRQVNLDVTVSDGLTAVVKTQMFTLVKKINKAPVVTAPSTQELSEDTELVFSSELGNAIKVSDGDNDLLTITLTASEGMLLRNSSAGFGQNTYTLSGSASFINSSLNGLIYRPERDANGPKTLTVRVSDGRLTTERTIGLQINSVNDAASISGTLDASLTESNDVLTGEGKLILTDVDNVVSDNSFTAQVANGKYGKFNLKSNGAWSYATDSARDEFVQGKIYTDSLNVEANDRTKGTITVSILGTNDAPVITIADAVQTIIEGSTTSLSTAITVTDVDSDTLTVRLRTHDGKLESRSNSSDLVVNYETDNPGFIEFKGTATRINRAIQELTYTPNADSVGKASVKVVASDSYSESSKVLALKIKVKSLDEWTAAQVAALSDTEVRDLTSDQLQTLSKDAVAGFSAQQIPFLSVKSIAGFKKKHVPNLSLQVIAALSKGQISSMFDEALTKLTPIQIEVISQGAMAGIRSNTLAKFSTAEKPIFKKGLTYKEFLSEANKIPGYPTSREYHESYKEQWKAYDAAQLPRLSASQVASITPEVLSSLTVSYLTHFSNEQFEFITAAQRDALAALRMPNGDVVTPEGLTMPKVNIATTSVSIIASWSIRHLEKLTIKQWNDLNENQINAIDPDSLAGFTTAEIFNKIPAASLKFLNIYHYRALFLSRKHNLDETHLNRLGEKIFKDMNAADFMEMTFLQRKSLKENQLQSLSTRVFQKLNSENINVLMTEGLFSKFTDIQIRNIGVSALASMSEKAFLTLLDGHFNKLVAHQIAVIPASFWAKVTSTQLESLQILSFQSLTADQVKNIDPKVINDLSIKRWSQLTSLQVASLTTSQINLKSSLKGLRVEGLTGLQIQSLPDDILNKLSASEISMLSLDAVKNLRLSQIRSNDNLDEFSATQLSNISADILKNLPEADFFYLNKTKLTILNKRGVDVNRYLKSEASGALLAKIMLASFHTLSGAGTYDRSKKGHWKELSDSYFDEIDKTTISLFSNENVNDAHSLRNHIYQKDSEGGDISAENFVKNNEIVIDDDGRKYISKYVTSWQNPKSKDRKSAEYEIGYYSSGNPIDSIAADVSNIFALSSIYGLHYLLNNLRFRSVHNAIFGNNDISRNTIMGRDIPYLGEAAFRGMDTATLTALLQLNTYQLNFKQTGGAHEEGSVSCDNPFGFGIVNTFSSELLNHYFSYLNGLYTLRSHLFGGKQGGMFSDELWNDISDQVKLNSQLLNKYGSNLTVSQMQRMSPNLFSSISGETLLAWSYDNKELFNAITPAQISVIPKASIKFLGEQIIGFNAIQFFAFTGIQIMGIATDSAWRKVQVNYSDIADKFVNEAPWHLSDTVILSLSPDQIVMLPEIVFERLLVTSMSRFNSTQVSRFSVSQVANLSAAQLVGLAENISYLSQRAARSLTAEQYNGLTERQKPRLAAVPLVKISAAELPSLLPAEMLDFDGKSFAKLSNEQLNSLTRAQVLSLLPSQYYALSDAQRKELNGDPAFVLNREDLKKLSSNDIDDLAAEQFAFLSATQLKALGKENFQKISDLHFKAISSESLSTLLINNHEFLSDPQVTNLKLEQLAGLDYKTASNLSTKWQVLLEKNKDLSEYLVKVSTPAGRLATDLRAVYVATNNSRSMRSTLDHPYLNTGLFTKDWGDDRARLIFAAQEKFVLNQRKSAEQRALLQKGRAAGSALAFGAVISAWSMANRAGKEGRAEDAAFFSLAGIAYLCSLLQVPFSEAYAAVRSGHELQGAVKNTANNLTVATQDEERAKRKFDLNPSSVVFRRRYNESSEAKRIAEVNNDAAKKALADHNHMVKVNWGISNITGGLSQTDFNAAVELRKSQISLPELNEIQMSQQNRELWKQHSKIFIDIDIKRQASRIFIAADLTSMASSGFKLSKAIRVNDSAEIAFGVVDMVGNMLVLLGDAIDFIKVSGNATKMFAARLSGPGNILIQCAAAGLSIYSNVKYYQSNPNSANARNAVIRDVVYQVVMLVITVSLMSVTPLLMVGAMVVMSIIPNAQAERILADLQDQQEKLLVEGRDVWANVVFTSLIKIAAMNLNGLTSIAANEVTAKVTSGLRESLLKHDSNLLRQLLSQDLRHYFASQVTERTIDGKNVQVRAETITTITKNIDDSNVDPNPQATKIAAFFNINRQEVDLMSLYASKESEIASYATQLMVLASSAGVVNFDVNASNPLASNIDIELFDVVGSKEDSLMIVNVTSDLNLRNDKPINIVSNLESNVANFFVSASKVKIVGSLDQHSLITIVDSRADDLLVESKSGRDIVMFAGAPVDGEGINSTNQKIKQTINLDNFTNVAFVLAGATTMANEVRGTKARQRYSFNNGRDDIEMSGGFGSAIVGGRNSNVLMGGGNNSVSVKLGSRAEYLPWSVKDAAGVYNGGAAVASVGQPGDIDARGQSAYSAGTNSISFSEAYGSLLMEILDPIQKAANNEILYSAVSTRVGPGIDMDVVDEGKFTNFQHVIGSNYGDLIKVNGTNNLRSVTLGTGQNSVRLKDVTSNASLLHIMSLANLAEKESDVTIDNSDVAFTGGLGSRNLLQISNSSTFIADLRGNDRIFTDSSSENVLDLTYSQGDHSLYLNGGSASVMMASDYSGDADIYVDSDASKSVMLKVTLSGEIHQQMVTRDAEGLRFSLMQSIGDAQEVSYQYGASAAGLESNYSTKFQMVDKSNNSGTVNNSYEISAAALNDAINRLSPGHTTSNASPMFTFDQLYQSAFKKNSSDSLPKS